jgi:hypothetical protein
VDLPSCRHPKNRAERRAPRGVAPNFRFIDTASFYGKRPADNLTSSLLQAVGPTRYAHSFRTARVCVSEQRRRSHIDDA